MRQRKHALSGAIYDVRDDGNVDVTSRDGVTGTFTPSGTWIEGDLRQADPHLCGWLAGPQRPSRLAVLPRFRNTGSSTTGDAGQPGLEMTVDETQAPALTYQQLLDTDSHAVLDVLRWFSPMPPSEADVSVERYTSAEFHRLEWRNSGARRGRWPVEKRTSRSRRSPVVRHRRAVDSRRAFGVR